MHKRDAFSRDATESLAIQMLTLVIGNTARLGRFLVASGLAARTHQQGDSP